MLNSFIFLEAQSYGLPPEHLPRYLAEFTNSPRLTNSKLGIHKALLICSIDTRPINGVTLLIFNAD